VYGKFVHLNGIENVGICMAFLRQLLQYFVSRIRRVIFEWKGRSRGKGGPGGDSGDGYGETGPTGRAAI